MLGASGANTDTGVTNFKHIDMICLQQYCKAIS
jgi:hypothetical protein